MKATELVLRCYAESINGQWQAFCLDLNLAAQGESFEEVSRKLKDMICEYVYDATVGDDKEYAGQLLSRRAPLGFWVKFYYIVALTKFGHISENVHKFFTETLPLTPYTPTPCNPQ